MISEILPLAADFRHPPEEDVPARSSDTPLPDKLLHSPSDFQEVGAAAGIIVRRKLFFLHVCGQHDVLVMDLGTLYLGLHHYLPGFLRAPEFRFDVNLCQNRFAGLDQVFQFQSLAGREHEGECAGLPVLAFNRNAAPVNLVGTAQGVYRVISY